MLADCSRREPKKKRAQPESPPDDSRSIDVDTDELEEGAKIRALRICLWSQGIGCLAGSIVPEGGITERLAAESVPRRGWDKSDLRSGEVQ